MICADSTNTYNSTSHTFSTGSSGLYDRVQYTYDRQGEMTSMEDQNQTTHTYAFNGVGQLLSDSVTRARRQSGEHRHDRGQHRIRLQSLRQAALGQRARIPPARC